MGCLGVIVVLCFGFWLMGELAREPVGESPNPGVSASKTWASKRVQASRHSCGRRIRPRGRSATLDQEEALCE